MWQKTKGRVHCALFVRKSCEQNWNGKRLVAMLREYRYAQVIRSKMHRGKFSKAAHSTRDHSDRKHFTFFLKEAQTFAIYSFRVQHHYSILPAVCVFAIVLLLALLNDDDAAAAGITTGGRVTALVTHLSLYSHTTWLINFTIYTSKF